MILWLLTEISYTYVTTLFQLFTLRSVEWQYNFYCWVALDMEGNGRGLLWINMPSFAWKDWETPEKILTSASRSGLETSWIRRGENNSITNYTNTFIIAVYRSQIWMYLRILYSLAYYIKQCSSVFNLLLFLAVRDEKDKRRRGEDRSEVAFTVASREVHSSSWGQLLETYARSALVLPVGRDVRTVAPQAAFWRRKAHRAWTDVRKETGIDVGYKGCEF